MKLSSSRSALTLVCVTVMLLAACGQVRAPDGPVDPGSAGAGDEDEATSPPPGAADVVDLDAEVVGSAMLLQSEPAAPVEACLGGVLSSYPPQCGGPALKGDFSWDELDPEKASGVTWTEENVWIVGHYDPADGEAGSFTLTRPVSAEPPDGFVPPARADVTFPRLCDDPEADVPDVDQTDRSRAPEGMDEEQALLTLLHEGGLDGYVTSWVSDGGATFNVIVTHDADAARATIREVFHGPLCVVERDLPTQDEVRRAQEALAEVHREVGLQSAGAGGASGLLEVDVVVTDQATVDAVHAAVAPWLTPDRVVITGALHNLDRTP